MWKTWLLILLCACVRAEAQETGLSSAEYGELYVVESLEKKVRPWQLTIEYSREFSNPYLNINGAAVSATRMINRHVGVGAQFAQFFSDETDATRSIQRNLDTQRISQSVERPSNSFYGLVTMVPLAGQLNLFSRSALPFELALNAGLGRAGYSERPSHFALLWSVSPQLLVSDFVGVRIGIGQEYEAPFTDDALARWEGRLGAFVRF